MIIEDTESHKTNKLTQAKLSLIFFKIPNFDSSNITTLAASIFITERSHISKRVS